jgi:hypothetical protein
MKYLTSVRSGLFAVKEAWEKRPELQQLALNLKNAGIEVKATRNELLPALNLFGEYIATGLGGVQTSTALTPTGTYLPGVPVVNAAGIPVAGLFEATALSAFCGGSGSDSCSEEAIFYVSCV